MPRRKISEYQAKKIVTSQLNLPYSGWQIDYNNLAENLSSIDQNGRYVVKVDQAVKGRFKKGLVVLDVSHGEIADKVEAMHQQGFDYFLVEPFTAHESADERYLSMSQTKAGMTISVSSQGGVDIESNPESVEANIVNKTTNWQSLAEKTGFSEQQLSALAQTFEEQYFTFLEINPYITNGGQLMLLDLAVEVDDAASLMVDGWTSDDVRTPPRTLTDEERTVAKLGENSPASFALQVINPNGAVFLLLSGGGASVTVADEVYSAGLGGELANYGEYSGNPTEEETFIYASSVLRLLLASNAPKKVLFVGGAVANFTSIVATFAGIIRALDEYADAMKQQGVKVVVRRGGPHQEEGLANIKRALEKYDLLGAVYDHRTPIGNAVQSALKEIEG